MVGMQHKERTNTENEPNRISVVRWVLRIWMSDCDMVGIDQSPTKKKSQGVLMRVG